MFVFQLSAARGLLKLSKLKGGVKVFTFHGTLGKSIIVLAAVQIIVACIIWPLPLNDYLKILIGVLATGAALCGAFFPVSQEREVLVSSRA